ncbi:MAG: hypothetical protein WKF37_16050 [Bryobacteraceae bacterium]
MGRPKPSRTRELRGHTTKAQSLTSVIQETFRLWRKHHLGYDQTKYVVEEARRRLGLEPPRPGKERQRLDRAEIDRLIQATYRNKSKYGLMIKTLFQTGARVDEFVHIRVEDLLLGGDPPQITSRGRSVRRTGTSPSCRRWQTNSERT